LFDGCSNEVNDSLLLAGFVQYYMAYHSLASCLQLVAGLSSQWCHHWIMQLCCLFILIC